MVLYSCVVVLIIIINIMDITPAEIEHCRNRIYTTDGNKVLQDQQICHHIIATNPARKRIRKEVVTKKHSISVEYIVNIF
jgi:hypothetical protein